MATDTPATVAEWLEVRTVIADIVKQAHPRSEKVIEVAEALMKAGVVDASHVLQGIRDKKAEIEKVRREREEREAANRVAQRPGTTDQPSAKPPQGGGGVSR